MSYKGNQMYKALYLQGKFVGVQDEETGCCIPPNPNNKDWCEFIAWNSRQENPIVISDQPYVPKKLRSLNDVVTDVVAMKAKDRETLDSLVAAIILLSNEEIANRFAIKIYDA
jgi:hypothetical protein